ncbi:hypothetical protein CKA32_004415 [Geitlerinema sp. FC II]|nr:hypothetical protein CKA32_004415 [Geitlerinema sp. FC II]
MLTRNRSRDRNVQQLFSQRRSVKNLTSIALYEYSSTCVPRGGGVLIRRAYPSRQAVFSPNSQNFGWTAPPSRFRCGAFG